VATVLIRSSVHEILKNCEMLSTLDDEQKYQLANAFNVLPLKNRELLQVPDVRSVTCIYKTVESSSDGFRNDMQTLNEDNKQLVGVNQMLFKERPWDIQVRGAFNPVAFVAIWRADEVNSILVHDDTKEKLRILHSIFLFKALSKNQLLKVAESMETEHKGDDEIVFKEGEAGDTFHIISTGRVVIEKHGRFIRALSAGDYFGEIALLTGESRRATVTAAGPCTIWTMSRDTFASVVPPAMVTYLKNRVAFLDAEYTFDDFEFVRNIGTGGFGVVKMVRNASGTKYALKSVRKQPIVELGQQESLNNERSVLAELDHPFVIKLVQSFRNDAFVFFLLEIVSGGELLDVLGKLGILNKSQCQFYILSILLALQHMHERKIAYLDLKSENVLVDQQGFCKVVDFGLAVRITGGKAHGVKGTPHFMCPEMILGKGYDTTADLWSVGVCLYEFLVGDLPFGKDCKSKSAIFQEVLKSPVTFPDSFISQPWYEESAAIIKGFLQREPTRRLGCSIEGFDAIFAHAFFAGYDLEGLETMSIRPPYLPDQERYMASSGWDKSGQNLATVEEQLLAEELKGGWKDPEPGWDDEFES